MEETRTGRSKPHREEPAAAAAGGACWSRGVDGYGLRRGRRRAPKQRRRRLGSAPRGEVATLGPDRHAATLGEREREMERGGEDGGMSSRGEGGERPQPPCTARASCRRRRSGRGREVRASGGRRRRGRVFFVCEKHRQGEAGARFIFGWPDSDEKPGKLEKNRGETGEAAHKKEKQL